MATLDDVRAMALALPEVTEEGQGHQRWDGWKVRGKAFAWERPLSKRDVADLQGLGEPVPAGDVIAVRVAREDKEAVLASVPGAFDIPHFRGYPAVLVELDRIDPEELGELLADAWLVQAPRRLAKDYLASRGLLGGE